MMLEKWPGLPAFENLNDELDKCFLYITRHPINFDDKAGILLEIFRNEIHKLGNQNQSMATIDKKRNVIDD